MALVWPQPPLTLLPESGERHLIAHTPVPSDITLLTAAATVHLYSTSLFCAGWSLPGRQRCIALL